MTTTIDTDTTLDVDRLRDALEYVTDHPESWDQSYWLRRTADGWYACLAGTIVLRAGYRPYVPRNWRMTELQSFVEVDDRASLEDAGVVVFGRPGGYYADVADVARYLLRVSTDVRLEVFYTNMTLRDLWYAAARLTRGAIRPTPFITATEDAP